MKSNHDNFFEKIFKIESNRLVLRIFTVGDITEEYIKALNSQEIIGLTESRYRKWSKERVKEYIKLKAYQKWESVLIGMFIKNTNKHIGNIRLHSFSKHNKRVEIGIMIWDKNEWGKDYGTEALKVIIDHLFKELKFHKICAEYYSINKASAKMFQKLKFKIEGVFKDQFLVNGNYIDAIRIAKFNK